MKIMIVEDDPVIWQGLKSALEQWNYEVIISEGLMDVLDIFRKENPNLVLMDVMLPYFNGYYWCEEIRKYSTVPILFISSKTENMDVIMAMQLGADDYIYKPIDMSVTIAKIQAILRRTYDYNEGMDLLYFKEFVLNIGESKLIREDREISLTATERMIMESLFQASKSFVSKDDLIEHCWTKDAYIDDNTLAVNITRIRKKLQKINISNLILSKRNVGYRLNEDYAYEKK